MIFSTCSRCAVSSFCANPQYSASVRKLPFDLERAPGHDVVERGHPLEQRDVLEGAGEAQAGDVVRRQVRAVLALEIDPAARRPVEAADDVQHRALARAIGADDRRNLAAVDPEADARDRLHAAEVEVDVVDPDDAVAAIGDRARLPVERFVPLPHFAERQHRLVSRVMDVGAKHVALRALADGLPGARAGANPHRAQPVLDVRILAARGEAVPDLGRDEAIGVDDEKIPALAGRFHPPVRFVVELVDLRLGRERHARKIGLHRADVVVQRDPLPHRSLSHGLCAARSSLKMSPPARTGGVRPPRPRDRRPRRRGSAGPR